ncbi:hypothetical protein B0T24DRAFT_620216 [Lasiosphaeria ovina]|uniref:Azaphilone pigments biosynthesis cluster protein L N-terminal domain-containing protein n=1 Tax=Lasiosphaeria ovina TaxID=92902 RepID=A0AAE0NBX2_9PEZI|nr:hypothetical protein B0T24DRAFT_620216 [Lasiosphaeria ovina]
MDPFSITVGCLALLGAVRKATAHLSAFTKAFREARPEMLAVSRHVQELENILQLLKHDNDSKSCASSRLQESCGLIQTLINNCFDVVEELNSFMQGCQTNTRYDRLAWSMGGKVAVERMDNALQGHVGRLKLALDIQSNTVTLDIKEDTAAILDSQIALGAHLSKISEHLGLPTSKSFMERLDASDLSAFSYEYSPTRESALSLGHFQGAPPDICSGWSPSSSSSFDSDAFTNTTEPYSPLTPIEDIQWNDSAIGLDNHFEPDHAGGSLGSFAGQAPSPVDNYQPGGYDHHTVCYGVPLAAETLPCHSDLSIAPSSIYSPSCLFLFPRTKENCNTTMESAALSTATSESQIIRGAFRREVKQRAAFNAPVKLKEKQRRQPPVTTSAATAPNGSPTAGQIREQFRRSVANVAATTTASINNTNHDKRNGPRSRGTHAAAAPREENQASVRNRSVVDQFKNMVWKKKMAGIGT